MHRRNMSKSEPASQMGSTVDGGHDSENSLMMDSPVHMKPIVNLPKPMVRVFEHQQRIMLTSPRAIAASQLPATHQPANSNRSRRKGVTTSLEMAAVVVAGVAVIGVSETRMAQRHLFLAAAEARLIARLILEASRDHQMVARL